MVLAVATLQVLSVKAVLQDLEYTWSTANSETLICDSCRSCDGNYGYGTCELEMGTSYFPPCFLFFHLVSFFQPWKIEIS